MRMDILHDHVLHLYAIKPAPADVRSRLTHLAIHSRAQVVRAAATLSPSLQKTILDETLQHGPRFWLGALNDRRGLLAETPAVEHSHSIGDDVLGAHNACRL